MKKLEYDKLTIYEVEELYTILLDLAQNKNDKLELDLQQVQKIDMTVIQLLISLQKTCEVDAIDFSLHNLSSEVVDTLHLCGCDTLLGVAND
ncbi:MAG: STAS domain-containing protein [Sulfurimonas sp.]|jgi:anti-anti-sigma factor|nr:STAS domain-containing protein [Sulfurimonas sp.]